MRSFFKGGSSPDDKEGENVSRNRSSMAGWTENTAWAEAEEVLPSESSV